MIIESISGIRGIIGEGLTPEGVTKYAAAFGKFLGKGSVIIGRDSRPSGETIVQIFARTLTWMGLDVVDVGIVPTPTVQLLVEKQKAAGGIVITASHNPFPWNGIKYIDKSGRFLNAEQVQTVLDNKKNGNFSFKPSGEFGSYRFYENALNDHIQNILNIPYLDLETIISKSYKVVVDAVNGAGSVFIPELLKKLGCDVVELHCTPDGYFPHTPEPLPENLGDLMAAVKENSADLGMAIDPDSDRLAIVSNTGEYLSEEYTLVMAASAVLKQAKADTLSVVTNLSTTRAVDDVAAKFGATVYRTAIGEINVSQKMHDISATVGGEGNGGIILPDSHLGRDSLVGAALILQFLSESDAALNERFKTLPQYKMDKRKAVLGDYSPDKLIKKLTAEHANDTIDTVDGLKILWEDRWTHIRKSNTEPIVRIYSEAPTMEEAKALGQRVEDKIFQIVR